MFDRRYACHLAGAGDGYLADAAAGGHPEACVALAAARLRDRASAREVSGAVLLLRRAAANGAAADAYCLLGRLYLSDAPCVPADPRAAFDCFARSGSVDALARLAVMHCGGAIPRPLRAPPTSPPPGSGQLVVWRQKTL